jgi:O-antigen/teichoic acid export membrane protein
LNLQVRTISKNRQLAINILASYIALFVQMGISFFLSPYIVRTVGVEAYGFVQFSYVLISYFAILSVALNSMSSRFIMVSCFRGDFIAANKYFASTFYANVILGAIIFPVLAAAILNIAKIINVPAHLLVDVQFLMGFMAVNFVVDLLATNLGISYYVSNKLYLFSLVQVYGHILRAVLLIGFFTFFEPYVAYIGLITLIITIFTQSANIYWKRRLIPDLNINRKFFDLKKVKELISSGVWNSITRLGQILQDGLDLLIANLMLSATAMGILAVAKIIPNVINMILHAMISTFLPDMTELYAKQKYDELVKSAKRYMKITGMIINIPIALLIAFGDILYALWFPTQDSGLLQLLSAYRVGVDGSWTSRLNCDIEKRVLFVERMGQMLNEIDEYSNFKYSRSIERCILKHQFDLLLAQARYKDVKNDKFAELYKKLDSSIKMKLFLRYYFPFLYAKIKNIKQTLTLTAKERQ